MFGKNLSRLICVTLFALALTSCSSMKVGSHQDKDISLSGYRTYAWIADDPFIIGGNSTMQLSPLLKKKIVSEIEKTLEAKGYVETSEGDAADFVLAYTVGTREIIDADSYPPGYGGPWAWHVYGRYYYAPEYAHRTYTEGTLGIDIFDGNNKEPVWHGWASKSIYSSDRNDPDPLVEKAVDQILALFPNRPN